LAFFISALHFRSSFSFLASILRERFAAAFSVHTYRLRKPSHMTVATTTNAPITCTGAIDWPSNAHAST